MIQLLFGWEERFLVSNFCHALSGTIFVLGISHYELWNTDAYYLLAMRLIDSKVFDGAVVFAKVEKNIARTQEV